MVALAAKIRRQKTRRLHAQSAEVRARSRHHPRVLALIHTPNDTISRVEPATLAMAADFFAALVMKLDAELS